MRQRSNELGSRRGGRKRGTSASEPRAAGFVPLLAIGGGHDPLMEP
jgi:hypothetical protein